MVTIPPINQDGLAALAASLEKLSGQARAAVEATEPRLAAAFEQMRRAMRGER